ncbi:MAG: histidine phosphatase family protein [Hyphomicrobiaceae bacterium]|nr:histidine phosphatase family protein [Hyphomicrobiaceae bacterium]
MAVPEGRLVMVRHTEVAARYRGVCYGASDIALSEAGLAHIERLATELAAQRPDRIVHSGLTRARLLAEAIAQRTGLEPLTEPRIAECNFGAWELNTWDDIFATAGHDIGRLVSEPDTFAPPGGETVHALRDRVLSWYRALPGSGPGLTLAITHGGPIGVLLGHLRGLPASAWPRLVPAYGEAIELPLRDGA